MFRRITLEHVGPAERLELKPAPRFNLITGDNGLGKSFLLETIWWALTRSWHDVPAVPSSPDAKIGYSFDGNKKRTTAHSKWDPTAQQWKRKSGRPPNPGMVLYARIDGSFSAWDPARNYRLYQRADGGETESPAAYQFSARQVLNGLSRQITEAGVGREQLLCAGLIDDWTRWQESGAAQFELLRSLLTHLGPDEQPLLPGAPRRPTLDDVRRIPTIRMPYGQEIPITYCPAGVRRACNIAYLLTWTLSEHQQEAERLGQELSRDLVVLIDEPETHLHPRWQRTILPSLEKAIAEWHPTHRPNVQVIVATHSPIVLASMEPIFDPEKDALWKLHLVDNKVVVERDSLHKRGDVNRWLESDVFDLGAATSREAERALQVAAKLMQEEKPDAAAVEKAEIELGRTLPQMDPFFIRWRHYMGSQPSDSR